ncbi:MAG: hypothetical protein PCFJNLEI_00315 [Verrucomicrobiae bacterium]|nr:hypothetical protein [Verrucomicrobiae bacterium]
MHRTKQEANTKWTTPANSKRNAKNRGSRNAKPRKSGRLISPRSARGSKGSASRAVYIYRTLENCSLTPRPERQQERNADGIYKKLVCVILNLSADASDAEIKAAAKKFGETETANDDRSEQRRRMLALLGLKEPASDAAIVAAASLQLRLSVEHQHGPCCPAVTGRQRLCAMLNLKDWARDSWIVKALMAAVWERVGAGKGAAYYPDGLYEVVVHTRDSKAVGLSGVQHPWLRWQGRGVTDIGAMNIAEAWNDAQNDKMCDALGRLEGWRDLIAGCAPVLTHEHAALDKIVRGSAQLNGYMMETAAGVAEAVDVLWGLQFKDAPAALVRICAATKESALLASIGDAAGLFLEGIRAMCESELLESVRTM